MHGKSLWAHADAVCSAVHNTSMAIDLMPTVSLGPYMMVEGDCLDPSQPTRPSFAVRPLPLPFVEPCAVVLTTMC
jgi:hypothetical protein